MFQDKKPKILCVDDEKLNLKLLKSILEPEGYEVWGVESGEAALAQAAEVFPDLILLDIMMPKMNGFEALRKLRADEKTRVIPVVMVTALVETEDRVKALKAGCDDFISKPFDKTELLARVKSILKISYYRRQLDERDKFKAVLDEMSDGIAICGPDWVIKDSNAAVLKYLNISDPADVNLAEIIFNNYSVSITKEKLMDLTIARKTFDISRGESEKTKALCLEANLDVVKNPSGEISSIVFAVRDVTQARREEFVKQDFLGMITHKLLTPLTIIRGDIALLQDGLCGLLTDKQKETIDAASKHSFLLILLVEKLLGFNILYSQKLDQLKETIELKSYLPVITNLMIKCAENKKVELNVDCQEDVKLEMNKVYFDQVMGNLIENAIKFNDKDAAKISIVVKKVSGKIEISVIDNGPGIPNEEYERIFEMFCQVEKYFTGQVKGAGLGLAVVKKLIEGQMGEIKVKSKLGEGSAFIFTLPVS
ncbi:MAG: response regulator [Candidatus Omnitrophota bacterium]